jgi:radical SAM protein with 4Fe4S-binding SPASM domain
MATPSLFQRLFSIRPAAPKSVKPGLYHYVREADGAITRFHLRVEPDGRGLLIANASLAARLSPSGVLIARGLLNGEPDDQILRDLGQSFRGAAPALLATDLAKVRELIAALSTPGEGRAMLNLDDAALVDQAGPLIAPLNADVSLAPPEQMRLIVARLWEAGIPHLTLAIPEDPDLEHLVRAVERAEDTGLISGVRGRATDLLAGSVLDDLAQAGIDHVDVFYASSDAALHDALLGEGDHAAAVAVFARVQALEVAAVAVTPLVESTLPGLTDTLGALHELGVTNVNVFAVAEVEETNDAAVGADAMPQAAALVEEAAHRSNVRYVWQPPVRRNFALTLAAQVRRGPRCSSDVSIHVAADGGVIPPRGPRRSAGNLLNDSWDSIWQHAEFRRYRERVLAPTRCDTCPGLAICAADCPREPAGWSSEEA